MDAQSHRMARAIASSSSSVERRTRAARLGLRVDARTKAQVERAARLERRSLTDFCLTALEAAARAVIDRHHAMVLSERDRTAFYDALVHPPKPNARLKRALRAERTRVVGP